MSGRHLKGFAISSFLALSVYGAGVAASSPSDARTPLTLSSGRISIAGTSNIHDYAASTTNVRVVQMELAEGVKGPDFWDQIVKPGAIESFEIAIAAGSLSSPREGIDKNMHKALKVEQFPEITFRLTRLESATAGAVKAIGVLRIAGVDREVALDLKTSRKGGLLVVTGSLPLLMTDYGIKPPTAMFGTLRTGDEVKVNFELTVGARAIAAAINDKVVNDK